ncbi:MAG: leucine-rich repeat domain-containing protein [Lachnospiraceae bacterium]
MRKKEHKKYVNRITRLKNQTLALLLVIAVMVCTNGVKISYSNVFAAGNTEAIEGSFSTEEVEGKERIRFTASSNQEEITIKGIELPDGSFVPDSTATYEASQSGDYDFIVHYEQRSIVEKQTTEEAVVPEETGTLEEIVSEASEEAVEEPLTEEENNPAETGEEQIPSQEEEILPEQPEQSEAVPAEEPVEEVAEEPVEEIAEPEEENHSLIMEVQAAEIEDSSTKAEEVIQSGTKTFTYTLISSDSDEETDQKKVEVEFESIYDEENNTEIITIVTKAAEDIVITGIEMPDGELIWQEEGRYVAEENGIYEFKVNYEERKEAEEPSVSLFSRIKSVALDDSQTEEPEITAGSEEFQYKVSMVSLVASPESDFTFDKATQTITAYVGSGGDVVVPSSIDGVQVLHIGANAFASNADITSVTMQEGLISIGDKAFFACKNLTNVTIPDGVTTIGSLVVAYGARDGKTISVNVPDSVSYIGDRAFCGSISSSSSGGREVIIVNDLNLNNITYIGNAAFASCKGMTNISLSGNNYTLIKTFGGCHDLISISLSGSNYSISSMAFWGCINATNLSLSGTNYSIADSHSFSYCKNLSNVDLGNDLKSIGWGAFPLCYSLTSLVIPSSITKFDNDIFDRAALWPERVDPNPNKIRIIYMMQFKSTASGEILSNEPWGAEPENVYWLEDIINFDHATEVANREYAANINMSVECPEEVRNKIVENIVEIILPDQTRVPVNNKWPDNGDGLYKATADGTYTFTVVFASGDEIPYTVTVENIGQPTITATDIELFESELSTVKEEDIIKAAGAEAVTPEFTVPEEFLQAGQGRIVLKQGELDKLKNHTAGDEVEVILVAISGNGKTAETSIKVKINQDSQSGGGTTPNPGGGGTTPNPGNGGNTPNPGEEGTPNPGGEAISNAVTNAEVVSNINEENANRGAIVQTRTLEQANEQQDIEEDETRGVRILRESGNAEGEQAVGEADNGDAQRPEYGVQAADDCSLHWWILLATLCVVIITIIQEKRNRDEEMKLMLNGGIY